MTISQAEKYQSGKIDIWLLKKGDSAYIPLEHIGKLPQGSVEVKLVKKYSPPRLSHSYDLNKCAIFEDKGDNVFAIVNIKNGDIILHVKVRQPDKAATMAQWARSGVLFYIEIDNDDNICFEKITEFDFLADIRGKEIPFERIFFWWPQTGM